MSGPLPTRRQLLAGGLFAAAAGTAGCLGLFEDDPAENAQSRQLELSMTPRDGSLRAANVSDAADPPEQWADGALEAALADEDFTTQYRKPFFARPDDPVYLREGDTYYELDSVIVEEATETRHVLRLYAVEDGSETPDGIATESLPDGDQRAVEIAHMAARARGNVGGMPVGLVERGGYVYRDDGVIADSRFLSGDRPSHVTFRDSRYRVDISSETVHEPVYRARATPVAETSEQMERIVRARFVDARLSSENLSTDAQEIVREASGSDTYRESHPYSDAFEELLTAMHKRPFLDGNIEKDARLRDVGSGMVQYDDTYYDYGLRFTAAT